MYINGNVEESIKAAEEDIASWEQQKKAEDGRVSQGDITDKISIAQDLIKQEIDELKLFKSHCNEDRNSISKSCSVAGQRSDISRSLISLFVQLRN